MNERLEIEIARYSGRISPDKAKNQPFATLDKCARYFYKLALEDVRKEAERIVEEETPISKGSDYYHGVKDCGTKVCDFIVQQNK